MSELPDPPVPEGCDLRGMPYMPLDIARLFDSDFYVLSNGEEFKAGLSLWGKAFLQQPSGSLPSDDRLLAHLSGAGHRWKHVKDMALRGWYKCSDGRLYHKVVSEKVADAWKARCDKRARTEAARAARAAQRAESDSNAPPTATPIDTSTSRGSVTSRVTDYAASSVTDSVTSLVTESKGTEGKIKERKEERTPQPPRGRASDDDPDFDEFWRLYPRKEDKIDAKRAWVHARRGAPAKEIIDGLMTFEFSADRRYQKLPAGWLRSERWKTAVEQFADGMDPVLRAAGVTQDDIDRMYAQHRDVPLFNPKGFLQ